MQLLSWLVRHGELHHAAMWMHPPDDDSLDSPSEPSRAPPWPSSPSPASPSAPAPHACAGTSACARRFCLPVERNELASDTVPCHNYIYTRRSHKLPAMMPSFPWSITCVLGTSVILKQVEIHQQCRLEDYGGKKRDTRLNVIPNFLTNYLFRNPVKKTTVWHGMTHLGLNFLQHSAGVFVIVQFAGHGQVLSCLLPVPQQSIQGQDRAVKSCTYLAYAHQTCIQTLQSNGCSYMHTGFQKEYCQASV